MAQIGSCLLLCISVFVQRRMSADVNPSLVNWLTNMMSMRLHIILEHNPVTEDQIQHYVIHLQVINRNSVEQIFLSLIRLLLKPHYLCRYVLPTQVIQTQSGPNIAEKVRVMIKHKFECIPIWLCLQYDPVPTADLTTFKSVIWVIRVRFSYISWNVISGGVEPEDGDWGGAAIRACKCGGEFLLIFVLF